MSKGKARLTRGPGTSPVMGRFRHSSTSMAVHLLDVHVWAVGTEKTSISFTPLYLYASTFTCLPLSKLGENRQGPPAPQTQAASLRL